MYHFSGNQIMKPINWMSPLFKRGVWYIKHVFYRNNCRICGNSVNPDQRMQCLVLTCNVCKCTSMVQWSEQSAMVQPVLYYSDTRCIFLFQNHPKHQDLSSKTYLDFWEWFGRKRTSSNWINMVTATGNIVWGQTNWLISHSVT